MAAIAAVTARSSRAVIEKVHPAPAGRSRSRRSPRRFRALTWPARWPAPGAPPGLAGLGGWAYRWVWCVVAFDVAEDPVEQGVEFGQLAGWQCVGDELAAQVDEVLHGLVVELISFGRQDDLDADPVGGVDVAFDVAGPLEAGEAGGHAARGDLEGSGEFSRRVMRALAVGEGEQDLRVAEGDTVACGDLAHCELVVPGDLHDPFRHRLEHRVGSGMARQATAQLGLNGVGHQVARLSHIGS